jgi:hypothetical protein
MERVQTLLERLNQQVNDGEPLEDLLHTVELMQHEIRHLQSLSDSSNASRIAFQAPVAPIASYTGSDKVTLPLDINPEDVEAELEQIRQIAEAKNNISIKNRRTLQFDPIEDTPTLSHQIPVAALTVEPVNAVNEPTAPAITSSSDSAIVPPREIHEVIATSAQTPSLNESLNKPKREWSERLQETPIKDLKKAIGINDRFLFIQELFQGDESMYERSLKTINAFSIYPEAEYWIRRELKTKLGWNDQSEAVQAFTQLVKRRFSAI